MGSKRPILSPLVSTPAATALLIALLSPLPSLGEILTLKNGMQFEGAAGRIASMANDPLAAKPPKEAIENELVVLVNDNLRWTFFSHYQVQASAASDPSPQERIQIPKRVARGPRSITMMGPILRISPFDDWGNRIFSMGGPRGPVDVIQGITEITPTYTKVEGLVADAKHSFAWDMRLATSSLPSETIRTILAKQMDPASSEDRLSLVRLFLQAKRYEDARSELEAALKDFPELAELQNRVKALRQLNASRLLEEIEHRREGGQHELAARLLRTFPEEGVAGETLLKAREMLGEYERRLQQVQKSREILAENLSKIADAAFQARVQAVLKEIEAELSLHTLDRMADCLRLADDKKLVPEQKLSLAISGWLLGSGAGSENLGVSLSLFEARAAVRGYLQAPRQQDRDALLEQLKGVEGVSCETVAKLLAHMPPPNEPPSASGDTPGLFELSTPGLEGEPDIAYWVQVPPEYSPYRRYPCVVTLNGGASELQQIEWWAGQYDEKSRQRLGQATRHGYIVIAPRWRQPRQRAYGFSAREHAAVLYSLRDALRRFAIDTDRVFLSGHSLGGDAAWDIGLAHPDLWAGVVPIVATSDKYIVRYWKNAARTPFYFVCGQLDGDKMARNGVQWDRYLTKVGFNAIVVSYQGRGHEHFYEEIQRIFAWMERCRRDFFPREFECVSMRPWDNFFWWVEASEFPDRSLVEPLNWQELKGKEAQTQGRILATNGVSVNTAASRAAVWLSPEMVDFDQPVAITVNRRRQKIEVQPSVEVMLEDARTRGDRQHPFWAKVQ